MFVGRILVAGALVLLALTAPVLADARSDAFEEVISAQIEAFARDDGDAAFSYATPDIQMMFRTPARFMDMVRNGFEPVYRPRAYSFETPLEADGQFAQPVRVIGPDGRGVIALYHMEEQPDGSWRIGGVTLHPIAERGI